MDINYTNEVFKLLTLGTHLKEFGYRLTKSHLEVIEVLKDYISEKSLIPSEYWINTDWDDLAYEVMDYVAD